MGKLPPKLSEAEQAKQRAAVEKFHDNFSKARAEFNAVLHPKPTKRGWFAKRFAKAPATNEPVVIDKKIGTE